jgi:hypothetical protein
MSDPLTLATLAASGLGAVGIAAAAGLKGWQGWLDLKRQELAGDVRELRAPAMERIEVADLKERVRKLEAIAAYVDP